MLVRDDGKVVAVEVKLSATVGDRDIAHLRWLADRLGVDLLDAVVVNTGPNAYRRPDGIGWSRWLCWVRKPPTTVPGTAGQSLRQF